MFVGLLLDLVAHQYQYACLFVWETEVLETWSAITLTWKWSSNRKVSGTLKDAFISRRKVLHTEWCCRGHSLLDLTLHAGVPVLWLTAWRYVWRIQTQHSPFPLSPSCSPPLLLSLHVPSLSSFLLSGFSLSPCHFQIVSLHFSHPSLLLIYLLSSQLNLSKPAASFIKGYLILNHGWVVCVRVCQTVQQHVYFWPTVKHTNYTSSHITWFTVQLNLSPQWFFVGEWLTLWACVFYVCCPFLLPPSPNQQFLTWQKRLSHRARCRSVDRGSKKGKLQGEMWWFRISHLSVMKCILNIWSVLVWHSYSECYVQRWCIDPRQDRRRRFRHLQPPW